MSPRTFATTRWSVVVRAGQADSPDSRRALATLCETYWYPVYAYIRRQGQQAAEAQDLAQAFFTELLEKQRVKMADQQRGRFRAFLLASVKHYLANQCRAERAQKRGGKIHLLSIDFADAESRYSHEPAHELTPERIFERRWALTLLENALNQLSDEYDHAGKRPVFEQLRDYLGGGSDQLPYREVAERLGLSEGAVKVAVHRLRKRCREILRAEIRETVSEPEEVDDELQNLFSALSN